MILMPMPVKPGLSPQIKRLMYLKAHALKQTTEGLDIWMDTTEYPPAYDGENFFGRLARMRQSCIDTFLRPYHTEVLWIDADIIDYPPNLYYLLRAASPEGIISPIILIDGSKINYDTAGMRESYEQRSNQLPPYFSRDEPLVDVKSVGGCVLVPADVHRAYRFRAQPDNEPNWVTEWWSICEGAIEMGHPVRCATDIPVYHANLPAYGENFH